MPFRVRGALSVPRRSFVPGRSSQWQKPQPESKFKSTKYQSEALGNASLSQLSSSEGPLQLLLTTMDVGIQSASLGLFQSWDTPLLKVLLLVAAFSGGGVPGGPPLCPGQAGVSATRSLRVLPP